MAQQLLREGGKAPLAGKFSYEEFLVGAEGLRAEWQGGEVVLLDSASFQHQCLLSFVGTVLRFYVEEHALGVVVGAFQMKLPNAGREPDLMFVAEASMGRLRAAYLDGPAELVVEVISLESRARDRGDKFYEYEQGGVKEYWLLDPIRRSAEFYQLDPVGVYQFAAPIEGGYHSREIDGLTFRPEWLWQDPLPKASRILREWGLLNG